MFHRIPREIIRSLAGPRRLVVLDPFCGSGTVLLEGALQGHSTIGVDVNPLARLIAEVKTTLIDPLRLPGQARRVLSSAQTDKAVPSPDSVLDFWFSPDARTGLFRLHRAVLRLEDPRSRRFFLITLSSIIRRVSLADPNIAPPVRLNPVRARKADPRYRQALHRACALTMPGVFATFHDAVERNIDRMTELTSCPAFGSARILPEGRTAHNTGLDDRSIDLIVTSPPYCGAQKYVRSLRLEMLWLGFSPAKIADTDRQTLGTERIRAEAMRGDLATPSPDANTLIEQIRLRNPTRAVMASSYINYLYAFATECRRLLKPGGHAFVSFGSGHIATLDVDMSRFFSSAAASRGLKVKATLIDEIPSRGLLTKRHTTAGTIPDETVVWLER
jgi:DNA modification methylase